MGVVGRAWWTAGATVSLLIGCATGQDDAVTVEQDAVDPDKDLRAGEATPKKRDAGTSARDSGTTIAPPDGSAPTDASVDASDSATPPVDAGRCAVSALGGIGIPTGSVATANRSYLSNTPNLAIDGKPDTYWNSGKFDGSLRITFPAPQPLTGVRISAGATPASSETYQVYGYQGAIGTFIGSLTTTVSTSPGPLPPIALTAGTYDAIVISVDSVSSWVAVVDVSILTAACP